MRICAARCGANPAQSAHLLERYEREYVQKKYDEFFIQKLKIESNVAFRELPEWAEKKNSELQITGNGLNFA
jgi:hypothetical protein